MDLPEIITSEKGSKKLLVKGNIFYRKETRKGSTYWRCARNDVFCNATAITISNNNQIIVKKEEHRHAPNQEVVEAEKVRVNLKSIAKEHPEATPAQIRRQELPRVPSAVLSQLPDRENLKKAMRRERRRDFPAEPLNLAELGDIPPKYQRTTDGENFILVDTFDDEMVEDRVIAFATWRNLQLLANSRTWFLDGTFKTAPNLFNQIFVIMGIVSRPVAAVDEPTEDIALPLVYGLLPSKTEEAYKIVLTAVRDEAARLGIANVTPTTVMTDFEIAIIKAVADIFPRTSIKCCSFHLGQSMNRRIQAEGLQAQYNNPQDRRLKDAVHMLLSTAFVPEDDLEQAFELLYDDMPDDLIPVATYFDENYVNGRRGRGRRRAIPPRYSPTLWNCYESTLQNIHRTNNTSEGWHNKFQQVVGKHHPSLYSCLTEIIKEQSDTETILRAVDLGQRVKAAPRKKWITLQDRIRRVVASYDEYEARNEVLDYLRTLGHNFIL